MFNFINNMWIRFTSNLVCEDPFGNQYFEAKKQDYFGKKVREVIYKGTPEPSKIPQIFHAWLHHVIDEMPTSKPRLFAWQKDHTPNLTGTNLQYSPCGNSEKRGKISSDYKSWQPN